MTIYISVRSGQVRYGGNGRSSASPRPSCDGTSSASIWPSPRQTPCPLCQYPSDRVPLDATMKPVDAPSAWCSTSDLVKKESDGRDPPLESRHMPIEAKLALTNYAGDLLQTSLPEYQVSRHIVTHR